MRSRKIKTLLCVFGGGWGGMGLNVAFDGIEICSAHPMKEMKAKEKKNHRKQRKGRES